MTHHFCPIDNHCSVGRHGHNRHTKVHSQGVDVCYNRKNPKVKITHVSYSITATKQQQQKL